MQDAPIATSKRHETRLFATLAVIALPTILAFLPERYQFVPRAAKVVIALGLAIPMLLAEFAPLNHRWQRLERRAAAILLPVALGFELVLLTVLLRDMALPHSKLSGMTLLTTSISIWSTNILIFALAYWQLDRGGPTGRMIGWSGRADFTFPRGDPGDGVPEDWQPIFADYFALAFNTSAAFSPTDVLPLTPRAKTLMTLQSIISLVTVIAVGARAINILGS